MSATADTAAATTETATSAAGSFIAWFSGPNLISLGRAAVIVVAGLVLARVLGRAAMRFSGKLLDPQQSMLLRRGVKGGVLVLTLLTALGELGFDTTVLVGAAGILTVALGFASQASMSNVISGLFLVGERPFVVGDVVTLGTTTGEVMSIDLMAIKLRTFDNRFVRVPNESVLKGEVVNLSRYAVRRFDLVVGVAYHEQISRVREIILEVLDIEPLVLDEPQPIVWLQDFGASSLDIKIFAWATRENYWDVLRLVPGLIKAAFDEAGVSIPFPQRTLWQGSANEPFRVQISPASTDAPPDEPPNEPPEEPPDAPPDAPPDGPPDGPPDESAGAEGER